MGKYLAMAALSVLLFTAGTTFGQDVRFIRNRNLQIGVGFKTWQFEGASSVTRFTQVAFPFVYRFPLSSRLGVDVVTSPFLSKAENQVGDDVDFNDVTDTLIRASYLIGNHFALLTVGVGVPTGETELSLEEFQLSGLAANRPLGYPVSNFGTGLSVHAGLAVAQQVGAWVLGLGVGYSFRDEYDATLAGTSFTVDPGDEFNLTFGLDREFSEGRGKFSADFIYTNYGEDQTDGQAVFEAGDKFVIRGQLLFPLAIFDPVIVTALYRWRLDNRSTNAALLDNSNQFYLRAAFWHPLNQSLRVKYVLDADLYSNTVDDANGATLFGFGAGLVLRLSRRIVFDPTVMFRTGKIDTGPGTQLDLTGLEVTGGFNITY